MENLILSVPAMHCNHCVHTIEMEISALEGVQEVHVDLEGKSVNINYSSPASETQIRDLLEEINYPAEG
jgi:copper ion binding protein